MISTEIHASFPCQQILIWKSTHEALHSFLAFLHFSSLLSLSLSVSLCPFLLLLISVSFCREIHSATCIIHSLNLQIATRKYFHYINVANGFYTSQSARRSGVWWAGLNECICVYIYYFLLLHLMPFKFIYFTFDKLSLHIEDSVEQSSVP